MEYNKKISGITTVTLVVTIIVMLILVGVVVANLVGKDGLIKETEEIMNGYDDYKHGEEEKIDELASGIKKSNEKVQIVLTVSTDEWTNQDIVARAEVRNKPNEYYVYMRASESSPWIQTDELTIKASEFTGEQIVTACIAEESDPSKVKPQRQVNIKIGNIDNQLPSQTAPELTLKSEETYKTIIAESKQTDTLSGIDESKTKFAIRKKGQTTWSSWQTESMFTDLEDGTTYEIKSKSTDKAGNEQESEVSEIRTKGRIALATIATIANQTYSGQAFTPEPTITFNGTTLIKGIDYNLSYTNNTNAGTATVLVVGIGQYLGDTQKTFTINRATPTLTLSNTTVIAGNSASFTATYNGDGTLSASSSDTSKATVSVSGKSVTVKGVAAGSATITVTASQGTNYASKTMTCSATVQAALYSVSSGSPTYHRSLSSAVSTCSAGGTVTALENTTESDNITINKNITINTNGKTLTRSAGYFTISSNTTTISGSGSLISTYASKESDWIFIVVGNYALLKTSGTPLIKSNNNTIELRDNANLQLGGRLCVVKQFNY